MTAIISKHGQLLQLIYANAETIELNKPVGCLAVVDPPHSNMYYKGWWVDIPAQPSLKHTFDYVLKKWVDLRTLEQVKNEHWSAIKAKRDAFEFKGFEFESHYYDSDQVSQQRILLAMNADVSQVWTTASNEFIELSPSQLRGLFQSLQTHIALSHERGRIARQLIYEAETIGDVEAIQF
ncbi:DUF4376 domain-containing protein [Acinetobacter sp.]|uniref:DUF4376 domain-containing protein n=1 Tax=Acinetobacter sp. TaxID=472 RepID=UPI0039820954